MRNIALLVAMLGACGTTATNAPKEEAANAAGNDSAAPAADARRGVEDPRAFVASHYDLYRAGTEAPIPEPIHAYSDRLRRLFEAYDAWARQHDDLVGSLNFDWWMNAQDWELRGVELSEESEGPDQRTIVARFDNAGRVDVTRFKFVRQSGRWYLDDVVNGDGGQEGWVLSQLLQERPE